MNFSEKFFFWTPRILSISFVLFISIFALDVFSEYSGYEIILPLFMHLLPSLVLLVVIAIAWKYEWFSTIVFIGIAVLYVWDVGFTRPLSWYLSIVVPASLVGISYLVSWIQKRSHKEITK